MLNRTTITVEKAS